MRKKAWNKRAWQLIGTFSLVVLVVALYLFFENTGDNDHYAAYWIAGHPASAAFRFDELSDFTNEDLNQNGKGFQLVDFEISLEGKEEYVGVWSEVAGQHTLETEIDPGMLEAKRAEHDTERIMDIELYDNGGAMKLAVIWGPKPPGISEADHVELDFSPESVQLNQQLEGGDDFTLIDFEVYEDEVGNLKFAGLWHPGTFAAVFESGITDFEVFDEQVHMLSNANSKRLKDIEGYQSGGETYWAAL